MHRSNKDYTNMKEDEDIYVAIVESIPLMALIHLL